MPLSQGPLDSEWGVHTAEMLREKILAVELTTLAFKIVLPKSNDNRDVRDVVRQGAICRLHSFLEPKVSVNSVKEKAKGNGWVLATAICFRREDKSSKGWLQRE